MQPQLIATRFNWAMGSGASYEKRSLAMLIARIIRETRTTLGWRQQDVADRARVSRSLVATVEAGNGNPSLGVVAAIFAALGVDFPAPRPPVLVGLPRDHGHGRCLAYAVRRLKRLGWTVATEVPVVDGRWRGSIDLAIWHPVAAAAGIIEIKGVIDDVGAAQRQVMWYERMGLAVTRSLGWRPRVVVPALLVLATESNDGVLARHRELVTTTFAVGSRQLERWLANPADRWPGGRAIALIDPAARGRKWLSPASIYARRTLRRPYRDLTQFLRSGQ